MEQTLNLAEKRTLLLSLNHSINTVAEKLNDAELMPNEKEAFTNQLGHLKSIWRKFHGCKEVVIHK